MAAVERGGGWEMHLGDCLEVMRGLERVDHVITDPPYEGEAHTQQRRVRRGGGVLRAAPLDFTPIAEDVRREVGVQAGRLARRWVIAFCQAEAVAAWRDALVAGGLSYRRSCVWVKPNGAPQFTGDRPGMGYESIACAHAPGASRWNGGGRRGVFHHAAPRGGEHPTTKPETLMLELVELFTDPGEAALDPFAGSGSTGVACLRRGRHFVGIEKDPRYFALACERLRAEESGSTLRAARAGQVAMFGGAH